MCRYLKDADLPGHIPSAARTALSQYTGSVPDAFLVEHDTGANRYYIVEVKYCRDTDHAQQETRAHEQHTRLKELMQEGDPHATVRIVSLLLGVSGVIYKAFLHDMETHLGVRGAALKSLAKKLHFQAAEHVQKVWDQRLAQLYGQHKLQNVRTANWSQAKQNKHTAMHTATGRHTTVLPRPAQHKNNAPHGERKRAHDTITTPQHRKMARTRL
jgi:hypothetical protein